MASRTTDALAPTAAERSAERGRWELFLAGGLRCRYTRQTSRVLSIALRATADPGLEAAGKRVRYPSCGVDADGVYHLIWAFSDLPGVTFSVAVMPDGESEWFLLRRSDGETQAYVEGDSRRGGTVTDLLRVLFSSEFVEVL